MSARRRLEEVRLAHLFLTRLPAGRLADPAPELSAARWAFPFVGLTVGLLVWASVAGFSWLGVSPGLAAAMSFVVYVLITGALHLDGLADLADGLGGGRDRAHCLEIMRDSRIGSYGTLALGLVGLIWVLAVAETSWAALPAVAVASRLAMLVVLVELPPARKDGLGHAAASGSRPYLPGLVLFLCLALPLGLGALGMMAVVCLIAAGYVAWRAQNRIQGQTGDVLGAVQITSETAALVALTLI